ncbi:SDR family NAD(P)-dependent oxidoreductase [Pseudonocardia sp. CA-107938]|uniref:SDR family NAD(P)-dependent oxidoreductase n=1 Tax=Pseudonocardia sp. CA-107938 TaxID=3240021 RepID=UPI003D8C53F1
MSNDLQHPIGSGFGVTSTARETLDGIDLSGTTAIVTGGYSGIGLETTRALVGAGAHVVVPARRPAQAKEALDGIERVEVDELDLGDLASVAAFADRFLATDRPLRAVVNSAGIMANPETRVGPGWESQFATNHLGHFALVNRLWPAIAAGRGRVVAVSSRGHQASPIRWADVHFTTGYDKWAAYGQAKTANVLFAVHLDALARDAGVRAFALHPGGILTPLQRHTPREEQIERGWILPDGTPNPAFTLKTPEQGAATQTWAAFSPQLDGLGGLYLEDCDVATVVEGERTELGSGVMPYAIDPEQAARLWTLSAELTGVDAFAGR